MNVIGVLFLLAQSPVAGVDLEPFPVRTGTKELRATLRLRQEGRLYWALFRGSQLVASSTTPNITARFDPPLKAGESVYFTVRVDLPDGKSMEDVVRVDVLNAPPEFRGADVKATATDVEIRPRFEDPEGDSLTFKVLKPEGFRMEGGVIRGKLPETIPFTVELEVSDGSNTVRVSIPVEKAQEG